MLNVQSAEKDIMKTRLGSISLLAISFVLLAWPVEAQVTCGPPSPPAHSAGCLSRLLSYYTNQAIYSGDCKASTLPRGVETIVARATANPFSAYSWDSGWTGEMVLSNPSSTTATTFKLTEYIGGFTGTGSSQSLSISAGDTIVVPFSRLATIISPSDDEVLKVTITPAKNLTCRKVSYYTWEHD